MAIDFSRVIQAAADAMVDGPGSGANDKTGNGKGQKHGLSLPRAFLIGAGVVTAGRLVGGSRGRDLLENLQQRLVEFEHEHFESDDDEAYVDEDFEEEEPEAEEDEDFEEEEPEEPEAEEDEEPEAEEDEEPEAEEDGEPEAEEDDDFEDEEAQEERPKRRRVKSGAGSGSRRSRR